MKLLFQEKQRSLFFRFHETSKNYILNTGPDMSKLLFVSDRGENCPCTYRALFFDFTAWWRYFSCQSIKIHIFDHFSATKMAPPGGDIEFVFGRSNSKFPTLSHAKKYLYPKKSCKKFHGT